MCGTMARMTAAEKCDAGANGRSGVADTSQ
jgi:hypothetical protein